MIAVETLRMCMGCSQKPATTWWYNAIVKKHTNGFCNECSQAKSNAIHALLLAFNSANPVIANICENEECGEIHWEEYCQECCDHEYDPDEGMMCINCDAEYPY